MVIPGFVATDRTTHGAAPRARRGRVGGRHPWELGLNKGATPDMLERLAAAARADRRRRPVLLVGWSLGGRVRARAGARGAGPGRAVVTLGSPFSGDPQQNNVWRLYEWVAGHPVDEPPVSASRRQAAGADAGDLVAARRHRRAAAGARARRRERQGGRDRLQPHGVRRVAPGTAAAWRARSSCSWSEVEGKRRPIASPSRAIDSGAESRDKNKSRTKTL